MFFSSAGGSAGGTRAAGVTYLVTDGGPVEMTVRKDVATALASADGQYQPAISDASGLKWGREGYYPGYERNGIGRDFAAIHPVAVALPEGSVTKDVSAALEASSIAKATYGRLYRTMGRLDSTAPSATYYLQAVDSATLPADGAVTHLMAPIKFVHVSGTDQTWDIDFGLLGIPFNAGCVLVLSSTEFTKTISGAYLASTNLVG